MDIKEMKKAAGFKKILPVMLIVLAAGVFMMIYGGKNTEKSVSSDDISEYTERIENKIEQTAAAICGGKVYVIVTLECGPEIRYAKNVTDNSEQTVISNGGPVAVCTVSPVIRGISVVCKNGDDALICRRITEALSCAYGVSTSKIYVSPLR